MLTFTPKKKPKSALLFSCSCALAALSVYALSASVGHPTPLLPLCAAMLTAVGVWFALRFALLSYRYELHGDVLCVVRCLFGREQTDWSLSLRLGYAMVSASDRTARRDCGKAVRVHHFLTVWPSEDAVVLYYRDGAHLCAAHFAPNDAFFASVTPHFPKPDTLW